MSVPKAPLGRTEHGLAPSGDGWFVLNARDAQWNQGDYGEYTTFEGDHRFAQLGINIGVIHPGQPSCMYHREDMQEDFLVLSGECLLLIEGEERHLGTWDFVHCPPWTEHVFVGAGDGPCAILGTGARPTKAVVYPESGLAQRHGAGVAKETNIGKEAYANNNPDKPISYPDRLLPDL